MTLQDLSSRIKDVNLQIEGINRERQINIGKQQTLKKQLDSALSDYEKKYGVKLTLETIEAEVAAVTAQQEESVERIEKVLALVRDKKYAEAEKLLGVSEGANEESEAALSVASEAVDTTRNVEVAPTLNEKVEAVPPVITETTPSVGGTTEKLESAPPTFGSSPLSYDDDEDIPAPPPPTFGKPSNRGITSFGDILSNASFNPQG